MIAINRKAGLLFAGLALLTLLLQGTARAHDYEIERIYFFGDSLSDAGNVYALTGMTTMAPWPLIPSAPYESRGFQFSNGKVWASRFARHLQTRRSGKASLFNPGKNGNYAFGGARARTGLADPTSAASQVALYLAHHGGVDEEALYVIQFGGNDLRDALFDPANSISIAVETAQAQIEIIKDLYDMGARNFLVANTPDIGLTPAVRFLGGSGPASDLALFYNNWLEGQLQALENDNDYRGITIKRLDFFGVLNTIVANPKKFGIKNTTDTCLMFLPPATEVCNRPGRYVFWDGLHPTKKIHRIVGKIAAALYDDDEDYDDDKDDD